MVNKVTLLGRLGKDPVIKHFSDNNAIAEFSLATTENYKDKEGKWVEVTDWHNIKLPSKWMAESAEKYLKKGSLVYIEGKIKTRSYDDKDGNKKYITEIVAEMLRRLDKREGVPAGGEQQSSYNNNSAPPQEYSPSENKVSSNSNIDDDLPF
jgi:single-strand DNA-binding protein